MQSFTKTTPFIVIHAVTLLVSSVQAIAQCTPPASGLVGWWQGDGNALDKQGTNNGTFTGAIYATGEVGAAFSFDGSGNNMRIPASAAMDVGSGPGMTIEAWIYSSDNTYSRPIVEWVPKTVGAFGVHFYAHQNGVGVLYANLYDTAGNNHTLQTAAGLVTTNVYHHVAVTYDQTSGIARLFLDGSQAAQSALGTFTPQTSPDLVIGYRPNTVPFGPIPFIGRIDEVSLYSRALATNEILAIYAAGTAGKCVSQAPSIVSQPTNQVALAGGNASFTVLATGTQPLSYQWLLNGTNLSGETSSSLLISNVQPADVGSYAVQITNNFGKIVSSNAVLTVNVPPSCSPPPSGLAAWWQGDGNADDLVGNDNGTVLTGVTFAPGMVNQAFNFDGANGAVIVPPSPSLNAQDLTIEAWIYPTDLSRPRPIFEFANATGYSTVNFWYGLGNGAKQVSGALFAAARDATNLNNNFYVASAGGLLPINQWSYVAFTFDSSAGKAVLFLNGAGVATNSFPATIHPNTSVAVNIGYRPTGSADLYAGARHKGKLDEVTLYSRALAPGEIQAIYSAGISGKCLTPIAPAIAAQPANQTLITGGNTLLSVVATGTVPLSYQWLANGTNIPGATNAILNFTNARVEQSGTYFVVVTNMAGSIASSNAVLTINPPPPCVPPPAGLVAWWPAEGNANDNEGANNGVFNGALYAPGQVGQSFNFDGSGNNVRVPASPMLDVGAGSGMTIEAWIYSTDSSSGRPIVEWVPQTVGAFGTHFWVSAAGPGVLYANLYDTANNSHVIQSATGAVPLNTNQHVAVTYDKASGIARLFVEGAQVAESNLGTFSPQTSPDLVIGLRPNTVPFGPISYLGRIDEVSLYSRALAPAEIQAIYAAGSSGKCNVPVAPTIFVQPGDQTVTIGQAANFTAQAGGTSPLNYQWRFNTNAIPGGTNSSLVLTNAQMSQAGMYSVIVSNAYGSVTSSNATLVVNFPPASINVVNAGGTAGQLVTVPVVLVANGNENALGFSLNFSPSQLTNVGVTLGTGASGASLQFNSGSPGTLGVVVAQSSGKTFAPGTQEVAEVSFISAVSASLYSAQLTFGDQPTKRQLADAKAIVLPANFNDGQLTLARSSFEADLAPLPEGDGSVTVIDWVQVGRYVAALDSTTNASQFQRADCAPRTTGGDGLLTVSDWVQAGRYAAGLDPLTLAFGPNAPSSGNIVQPHKLGTVPRTVAIQGPLMFQGQMASVVVDLEAQGNENGVGLSLAFDPKAVSYTGTLLGTDATSATMDVNANQASSGQLGIILALRTGTSFAPGTRQLLKISFQAMTSVSMDSPVTLTDSPVRREVADTNALPVVATYGNGTIEINPKPTLSISQNKQSILLSWPLWGTNFNLQQAVGTTLPNGTWTNLAITPVQTNGALGVTLPANRSVQFYRLQHQ